MVATPTFILQLPLKGAALANIEIVTPLRPYMIKICKTSALNFFVNAPRWPISATLGLGKLCVTDCPAMYQTNGSPRLYSSICGGNGTPKDQRYTVKGSKVINPFMRKEKLFYDMSPQ